jgi:SAM-dependent methyltransferase
MTNPWLALPLEDYEGHMGSPGVQQLGALSDLFREALTARRPASVAILGIAGGNGLRHVDRGTTKRVVGIDLNPRYLDAVRERFASLPGLQLVCSDLANGPIRVEPVDLVHAALVFEHAGLDRPLENALSLVAERGALSVVLQLPSRCETAVGKSPVESIQRLSSHFSLIDPVLLGKKVREGHFRLIGETRRSLAAGKAFWMGIFTRE